MDEIKESDWRMFRDLHAVALERFCRRALEEVDRLSADSENSYHQRYLAIYRYTRECDKELAFIFNEKRRSTALQQLACIQRHDLLTAEEFSRFSDEARGEVKRQLEIFRS